MIEIIRVRIAEALRKIAEFVQGGGGGGPKIRP
jgi:hypothetical protein